MIAAQGKAYRTAVRPQLSIQKNWQGRELWIVEDRAGGFQDVFDFHDGALRPARWSLVCESLFSLLRILNRFIRGGYKGGIPLRKFDAFVKCLDGFLRPSLGQVNLPQ